MALEQGNELAGQIRMAPVDDPIELPTTPANQDHNLRIEHAKQAAEGSNRQPVKSATLDTRHDVVTDTGAIGRVDLADAESMAQRASRPADLEVIHARRSSQSALIRH
jgi:hypothetical protein